MGFQIDNMALSTVEDTTDNSESGRHRRLLWQADNAGFFHGGGVRLAYFGGQSWLPGSAVDGRDLRLSIMPGVNDD